jgi:pSer/pThr/pTyr-binding forkhead associated (FHA) protein
MASVTFQVLDGLERGEIYQDLAPPITIGREDENDIRLNDERVSRYHAKVQVDDGNVILTDLDSTNGTRVNGHPVQMHVLQIGDQILIGRCLLVYGSPEELEERINVLTRERAASSDEGTVTSASPPSAADVIAELPGELFPHGPPPPPSGMTPLQRAQVLDLVAFMHSNLVNVMHVAQADSEKTPEAMQMPLEAWHRLQRLQMQLATSLKRINEP